MGSEVLSARGAPYRGAPDDLKRVQPIVQPFGTTCPNCGARIVGRALVIGSERDNQKPIRTELRTLCDTCAVDAERAEREALDVFARAEVERLATGRLERIPVRFRNARLDDVEPELRAVCIEWIAQSARSLLLTGTVGSGKTFAAWATLRAQILVGTHVESWRVSSLLDELRPGANNEAVMRACQTAEILFLDDLGAEKPSEWVAERLYTIIDARYADCLPVLVTTNVPRQHMAEQLGERITSRLAEMCDVFVLKGSDRRREGAR